MDVAVAASVVPVLRLVRAACCDWILRLEAGLGVGSVHVVVLGWRDLVEAEEAVSEVVAVDETVLVEDADQVVVLRWVSEVVFEVAELVHLI